MIGQIIPFFNSGHILSQQMLETLFDYGYHFREFLHIGYAEGIISGCRLTITEDTIMTNQGILCFQGKPFLVKEPVSVKYRPTNQLRMLKARYIGEDRKECQWKKNPCRANEEPS